jgi:hypothetical protein
MNTSQFSAGGYPGMHSTDPELGNGDLRVFWLAALIAILAVSAVVFFKMHNSNWRPATVAQSTVTSQTDNASVQTGTTALPQATSVVR